jgi:hypothetical protein
MLVKFWTRFARSGDPNGAEAPGTWVGLGLAISDKKIIPRKTTTRNSVPKHVSDENMLSILFAGTGFFVKLIFFMPFPSVLSVGIDSSVNFGMSTFFRGITEAVQSLFRGIFSERNSAANPR